MLNAHGRALSDLVEVLVLAGRPEDGATELRRAIALYERKGRARPVSAVTGLWYLLLGWFFFVGAIVWFVKTNGALNAYWRSQGAKD